MRLVITSFTKQETYDEKFDRQILVWWLEELEERGLTLEVLPPEEGEYFIAVARDSEGEAVEEVKILP